MVTGVAMDYTLFLLSAAKERYETHADPERSMLGAVQTSGRVVVSAAAIMVAVLLTFALSGPLAPQRDGCHPSRHPIQPLTRARYQPARGPSATRRHPCKASPSP